MKKESAQYIYGRNPVLSAIREDSVLELFLKANLSDDKFLNEAKEIGIKINSNLSNEALTKLVGTDKHQGVVAIIKKYNYSSLDEIISGSLKKDQPLILMLDGINDPHNLGAIIRSADAFSVDGIIIKDHGQVEVTPTVQKVSTGAIDYVKIAKVNNLSNAIQKLKDNGFWIYAADGSGDCSYEKLTYDRPTVLIMGSEGFGISNLVLKRSDFIIKIPMSGHVNSLNVSVATGILLSRIRLG